MDVSNILPSLSKLTAFGQINDLKEQQGKFGKMSTPVSSVSLKVPPPDIASQIVTIIFIVFALFLAYNCTQKGVKISIIEAILAICCSPFYVAYRLVKPC